MSNPLGSTSLKDKYVRLSKSLLDARGNLYPAKDYGPGELPDFILNKGQISVINPDEVDIPFQDFKVVTNTVPETKVDIQVNSSTKKSTPKKITQDLTPLEAPNPTSYKKNDVSA